MHIVMSIYLFIMIIVDALTLARYFLGTEFHPQLPGVLIALGCQSSLGIALDEKSHLAQGLSGFWVSPPP